MEKIAVLTSGGLDSCVLLSQVSEKAEAYPIYIKQGLSWESAEIEALDNYIKTIDQNSVKPLTILSISSNELYGSHWSLTGKDIPKASDSDKETFLPGRNLILLCLASVWCSLHDVHQIVIGTLNRNPFADGSTAIFNQMASVFSNALDFKITIEAPYRDKLDKYELIKQNAHLPLELSMTCFAPIGNKHCGKCRKCYQRKEGFQLAGITDRTQYI